MNQLQMFDELERFVALLKEKAVEERRIEGSHLQGGAALLKLVSYLAREQRTADQQAAQRDVQQHYDGDDEYWIIRSKIFNEINHQLDVFISQSR